MVAPWNLDQEPRAGLDPASVWELAFLARRACSSQTKPTQAGLSFPTAGPQSGPEGLA